MKRRPHTWVRELTLEDLFSEEPKDEIGGDLDEKLTVGKDFSDLSENEMAPTATREKRAHSNHFNNNNNNNNVVPHAISNRQRAHHDPSATPRTSATPRPPSATPRDASSPRRKHSDDNNRHIQPRLRSSHVSEVTSTTSSDTDVTPRKVAIAAGLGTNKSTTKKYEHTPRSRNNHSPDMEERPSSSSHSPNTTSSTRQNWNSLAFVSNPKPPASALQVTKRIQPQGQAPSRFHRPRTESENFAANHFKSQQLDPNNVTLSLSFGYPPLLSPPSLGEIHYSRTKKKQNSSQSLSSSYNCLRRKKRSESSHKQPTTAVSVIKTAPMMVHPNAVEPTVIIKKIFVVVNPKCGNVGSSSTSSSSRKALEMVQGIAAKHQVQLVVVETKRAKHAMEIAVTQNFAGFDALVLVGGSGTYREFVIGLAQRREGLDSVPPLGFVPSGLNNGLLTTLGQLDPAGAIKRILQGKVRKIDLGRCRFNSKEPTIMINGLSWGSTSTTSTQTSWIQKVKRFLNVSSRHVHMEFDGSPVDANTIAIFVQNSQHLRSDTRSCPEAQMDDGMLDVVYLQRTRNLDSFATAWKLNEHGTHVFSESAHCWRIRNIRILTTEPTNFVLDGDVVPNVSSVEIQVLPRALNILN